MDEAAEPLSIPWWIWLTIAVIAIGAIVVFVLKYQNADDEQYRPYRGERSSRRRSRRHRHRRRHRRDHGDLEE